MPTLTEVPTLTKAPTFTEAIRAGRVPARPDLGARLAFEDTAQEAGLSPHERITCRRHRRWLHHCISSPQHAIAVTGHRWCVACDAAIDIPVDQLPGTGPLPCPRCRRN